MKEGEIYVKNWGNGHVELGVVISLCGYLVIDTGSDYYYTIKNRGWEYVGELE